MPEESQEMPRATGDTARVAVLGANAWAVACVIPRLWHDTPGSAAWGPAAAVPLVLALGLAALHRHRPAAPWVLLGAFPIALAGAAATVPAWPAEPFSHVAALSLAAASLLAYGAVAARACGLPLRTRPTKIEPLRGPGADPRAPQRRARMRALMLAVSGVGVFALALVAPAWSTPERLQQDWDRAATDASVFVAVVGGVLGTVVMALFVAPAMRRQRQRLRRPGPLGLRVALLIALALTGAYVHRLVG
jgi:hypothetical protein